jgi:nucleotide-binding universal stress UspA family protein
MDGIGHLKGISRRTQGAYMKVLLAIDSSGASQYVIAEAASRPWPSGTVFCIQSVVDLMTWTRPPDLIEDAKGQAKSLVRAAAYELSRGQEVITEIQAGEPRKAISQYAGEWGADLIMLGSHRSNTLPRFPLGSVSHAVLRTAPCSVEIVRPSPRGMTASSGGMKILVGTDGSHCSEKAINCVAHRPWPAETLVRVISVREPVVPESGTYISYSTLYPADLVDEILERERRRADDALTGACQILRSAGLKLCGSAESLFGDPRSVLLDESKSWEADLVVLGSHGLHGLDRALLGSVSETVAMHAHCSVEVIHS